jgi:hypothetical protein
LKERNINGEDENPEKGKIILNSEWEKLHDAHPFNSSKNLYASHKFNLEKKGTAITFLKEGSKKRRRANEISAEKEERDQRRGSSMQY